MLTGSSHPWWRLWAEPRGRQKASEQDLRDTTKNHSNPGGRALHPRSQTLRRIKPASEQIMPSCCSLGHHHLGKSCVSLSKVYRALLLENGAVATLPARSGLWYTVGLCNGRWPPPSCKACQRLAVQGGPVSP